MSEAKTETSTTDEFQEVEGTFADPWQWEDSKERPADGKTFTGTYVGMDPSAPGKKPGETFRVYHFFDNEGKRRSMFGADLDSKMPRIPFQTKVQITFLRKDRLANGNDMRMFDVKCAKGTKMLEPLVTRN